MRRGAFVSLAIAFAALALWSAWIRDRNRRYALAVSLLYVTLVLGIAIAEEGITAPANQTESINVWYMPLAALFLIATAIAAAMAKFRHHA